MEIGGVVVNVYINGHFFGYFWGLELLVPNYY